MPDLYNQLSQLGQTAGSIQTPGYLAQIEGLKTKSALDTAKLQRESMLQDIQNKKRQQEYERLLDKTKTFSERIELAKKYNPQDAIQFQQLEQAEYSFNDTKQKNLDKKLLQKSALGILNKESYDKDKIGTSYEQIPFEVMQFSANTMDVPLFEGGDLYKKTVIDDDGEPVSIIYDKTSSEAKDFGQKRTEKDATTGKVYEGAYRGVYPKGHPKAGRMILTGKQEVKEKGKTKLVSIQNVNNPQDIREVELSDMETIPLGYKKYEVGRKRQEWTKNGLAIIDPITKESVLVKDEEGNPIKRPLKTKESKELSMMEVDIENLDDVRERFLKGYNQHIVLGGKATTIDELTGKNPDLVDVWKKFKMLDILKRHELFGATLTKGESESWNEVTVNERTHPDILNKVLQTRSEIAHKVLNRIKEGYANIGYEVDITSKPTDKESVKSKLKEELLKKRGK